MDNKYLNYLTKQYTLNKDQNYNHLLNQLWNHFLQVNISHFPITQKQSEKYFENHCQTISTFMQVI